MTEHNPELPARNPNLYQESPTFAIAMGAVVATATVSIAAVTTHALEAVWHGVMEPVGETVGPPILEHPKEVMAGIAISALLWAQTKNKEGVPRWQGWLSKPFHLLKDLFSVTGNDLDQSS